jgi:hypothetical protein
MATTPAARVLPRRSSAAVIGEQRTASDDLRKQKLHDTIALFAGWIIGPGRSGKELDVFGSRLVILNLRFAPKL